MKMQKVDYQNGKIYKITNDFNDTIFIGCTATSLINKWTSEKSKINTAFNHNPFIKKFIKQYR